ncbi:MAG: 3-deoxy-8-phosphooctulonate synthase [Porticoccus sp.]|nr:3-deoxy-8-phosphooctulonate synthase [Porticoccus sp.]
MKKKVININTPTEPILIGGDNPLVFIGGPCAIESYDHSMKIANQINSICEKFKIRFIFKSCYDKDCRSSPESFHGLGMEEGLDILSNIRNEIGIPVTSDFSDPNWAADTGKVCDLVQIPAYLCRQTSILKAAAKTRKPINLKKGQFMSPWNMKNSVKKLEYFGSNEILLTDRGTFFGYNMLINDMRSLPIMAETGYPVCFDASHSVQLPTSMGNISGGQREFIPHLVRAATATGINALFIEVHDNPKKAMSDKNTVLDIKYLERILDEANTIFNKSQELKMKYGDDYIIHET